MIIGIVGSEAIKFTEKTKAKAKELITSIVKDFDGVSSGHCHLGGIDIWAEEIGKNLGKKLYIFKPAQLSWTGYKDRNIQIALKSDAVYCITVKELPEFYTGMKFDSCYHCKTTEHIKSGGCWTVKYAKRMGKPTKVFVIS